MNEYYSSRRIENRNKYKLFFTFYESNRNESVLTIYLEFHRSNNSGFSKYFSRCRCCKINGCWRLVPGFQMDKQYSKERKSPGLLESTARPPLPPLRDHFLSIQRPRTAGQAGSREQRKVALKSSIATTSPIVIPRHRPHTSHASVRKGNSEASIFLTDFFNYDVKPKEAERRTSILSRKTDRAAKEMLNIDDVSSGSDSSHGSERPRSKGELGHSESSSDESIKHGTHTRFESDSLGSNSSNSNSDSLNSDSSDSSGGSSSDSEEDTGGRAQSVVRRIPGDQQFKFFASGYNEEEDGYSSSGRSSSDDSEVIINKLGLSITRDFTEQVLTHREQYSNTDQGNESSDDDSDQDNEGQRDDSSSDKEDGGSEPGRSKHLGSDSSSSGSSEETEDTEEGEIEAEHCGMGSSMKAWKTPPTKGIAQYGGKPTERFKGKINYTKTARHGAGVSGGCKCSRPPVFRSIYHSPEHSATAIPGSHWPSYGRGRIAPKTPRTAAYPTVPKRGISAYDCEQRSREKVTFQAPEVQHHVKQEAVKYCGRTPEQWFYH